MCISNMYVPTHYCIYVLKIFCALIINYLFQLQKYKGKTLQKRCFWVTRHAGRKNDPNEVLINCVWNRYFLTYLLLLVMMYSNMMTLQTATMWQISRNPPLTMMHAVNVKKNVYGNLGLLCFVRNPSHKGTDGGRIRPGNLAMITRPRMKKGYINNTFYGVYLNKYFKANITIYLFVQNNSITT